MACPQVTISTNAGIVSIQTLGTTFGEIWSEIRAFSFTKMHVKMLRSKWRKFCLALNVLRVYFTVRPGYDQEWSMPLSNCDDLSVTNTSTVKLITYDLFSIAF